MEEQFIRTEMLLGPKAMERLHSSHVAVFGLGGVGSWCAEALARAGVGALTLVDHDDIGVSNLNRQLEALWSTVGQGKAQAMADRIRDINPDCTVTVIAAKYDADHREDFFGARYDYIADAIDLVSCKLDLIETAQSRNVPILSALGTGNKLDAGAFRISDISKTEGCGLARVMRKELRARGIQRHKVIWSPEVAAPTTDCGEAPPPGRRAIPASLPWVPAVAGLRMAGEIVLDLTKDVR